MPLLVRGTEGFGSARTSTYNMTVVAIDGKPRKGRGKVDWAADSETCMHRVPHGGGAEIR